MLTSFRGPAAVLFASCAFMAVPAHAADEPAVGIDGGDEVAVTAPSTLVDDATVAIAPAVREAAVPAQDTANSVGGESGFELSGNVALVSDYRFRGVSFSDGDPALQGGIDLVHSSGFYLGTWGSTISGGTPYGELELDLYGGWSGDVAEGVTFDVGLLYYVYPTENELANLVGADTDYFEPYASIGTTLGPVGATLGVAYAWDQASLGDEDNLFIYTDFELGIPNTPITLTAHLGYTDGVFATDTDGDSFDWGLGAKWAITDSLSLGVNYVDTEGPAVEDFTDAGFFVTLGYSM